MKSLVYSFFLFIVLGCGPSPLLNHVNANEIEQKNQKLNTEFSTDDCAFLNRDLDVCGKINWLQGPKTRGESIMEVTFVGISDAEALDMGTDLEFELWMPAMGHGSAQTEFTRDQNVYKVENVQFIMRGDWEIRLLKAGSVIATYALKL